MGSTSTWMAGWAACLLLLAGCSGDGASGNEPSSNASPSARPSTSESNSPSPWAAEEAFIRRFFRIIDAAASTGETSALSEVSAADCDNCGVLIRNIEEAFANGAHVEGSDWAVLEVHPLQQQRPHPMWEASVSTARERWYDGDGEPVKTIAAETQRFRIRLDKSHGKTLVGDIDVIT